MADEVRADPGLKLSSRDPIRPVPVVKYSVKQIRNRCNLQRCQKFENIGLLTKFTATSAIPCDGSQHVGPKVISK